MDRWKIAYRVEPVKDVALHPGYPTLGITFQVENNILLGIEHILQVPDGGDALKVSLPTIRALLELLVFAWRTNTAITGAIPTYVAEEA